MDKTQKFAIGDLVRNFETVAKVRGFREEDGFLLVSGEYQLTRYPSDPVVVGMVDIGRWYADPAKCENLTEKYGLR